MQMLVMNMKRVETLFRTVALSSSAEQRPRDDDSSGSGIHDCIRAEIRVACR